MKREVMMVHRWQSHFGKDNGTTNHTVSNDGPRLVNQGTAQARVDFIKEELEEYLEANSKGDLVGVLDAILDIIYFTFGMIVIHGLEHVVGRGFNIVHDCNMSKLWPGDVVKISDNGKVLKPDTFKKPEPELERLVNE